MNYNPFDLMKQMGNWEAQMKTIKEQLASLTATGSAGAGMVEVTINGEHKVQKVTINDVMLSPENKGMIETLVASAFNDATDKIMRVVEDFGRHQMAKGFGNELN